MKYDLSSQRAIEDSARLAAGKARMEPNQGSYNAAWLHGYAGALKDCAKGLEPLQRLMNDVLDYMHDHMDSSELRRMFYEDMELSEEEVAFLGFDLDEESEELDGAIDEISEIEYVKDLGNGYRVQKVFANRLPDGGHGDIYFYPDEVDHPGTEVMIGYCVVDTVDGMVPMVCNDWNDTVEEAIADYEEHVVPYLEPMSMVVESWEDMQKKYPMDRDDMTEEEERAFVEDCYKLYEQEGFSPRFWDLGLTDGLEERVGQRIEVLGRCTVREDIRLEDLPMWKARFEDGHEIDVYAEEIIPSAMMANGCRWFKDVLEYDSGMADRVAGLAVDVMLPQEMADVTGKAVRDGNKYYLPEDLDRHMSLEEQIAGAEKQKTDPDGKAVERKLDL